MLKSRFTRPEKGFLPGEFFWNLSGPRLLQYWKSFENLENFALSPSDPHLRAWKKYNRAVGTDGSLDNGTRPVRWIRSEKNASTAICRNSAWVRPWSMSQRGEARNCVRPAGRKQTCRIVK